MGKAEIIIHASLKERKPVAAEAVKKDLCTRCPDKRCERGIDCKTYDRFVDAVAWELASPRNVGEGGYHEQSQN